MVTAGAKIYLDKDNDAYLYYDRANKCVRTNKTFVSDGDVQAFGASGSAGRNVKRINYTDYDFSDNRTVQIPADVTDVVIDLRGDQPDMALAITGDTADMDVIRIYVYDHGVGGSFWKYGNKTVTVPSGGAKMMALVRYNGTIVLTA